MSIIRRILEKFIIGNKLFNKMSDEKYLKMLYKIELNEKLNLSNPQTFNEKMQWLKLYDRKDIYTTMVDKYEAKKYVADIIGEEYIIPTLGIYDKFDDIDFDSLPNQFVIKCTHDSGGIVICKDKQNLNIKQAKKKINKCLKKNFYYNFREWPYKNVKPRIIVEKYMVDESEKELKDYKFFCFNEKVKMTLVCSNRFVSLKKTFFDRNWKLMNIKEGGKEIDSTITKPVNFGKMKQLAEQLAVNTTFIRIDFYEIDEKVYFGEITFFPNAGYESFSPDYYNSMFGEWIKLKQ